MKNKEYNAVIFDVDGVIAQTTEDWEWMDKVYREHFPHPDKNGYSDWEEYLQAYGKIFRALHTETEDKVFEEVGLENEQVLEAYSQVQDKKNRIMNQFSVYSDAVELLEYLDRQDYTVAAVSNAREDNVELFLEQNNLLKYFDFVTGVKLEDFNSFKQRKKPNPAMFQEAIQELNLNPETTVMIGDSSTDRDAARKIEQLDYIHLNRGVEVDPDGEQTVENLNELKEVF